MVDPISARRAAAALGALVALLVGGTVGFHLILHERWLAAFYRTIVTATHTEQELRQALEVLKRVGKRMGIVA